jgi:hypothetical protein
MKKYILYVIIIAGIAGIVSINMSINSQKNSNLSSISLYNVEVLADEVVEVTIKTGDTCNSGTYNKKNSLCLSCDNPCKFSYNSNTTTSTCP